MQGCTRVKHLPAMNVLPVSQHPVSSAKTVPHKLTEADAIDIWIARWLRVRRIDLFGRYPCDRRRIYEIWEGVRFPGARKKAWTIFEARYPEMVDQVDASPHRRIPRGRQPGQLGVFE